MVEVLSGNGSLVIPVDRVRLTHVERLRLGAEILRTYFVVRWWLLRGGLPIAIAAARNSGIPASTADESASLTALLRLGRSVERTLGVLPFDSKCLIRSVVLVRILARRGFGSTMVIGVSAKPSFAAHAWVEYDGVPLLPTDGRFQRLTEM